VDAAAPAAPNAARRARPDDTRGVQSFALIAGGTAVLSLLVHLALVAGDRLAWTSGRLTMELVLGLLQGALAGAVAWAARPARPHARAGVLGVLLYATCALVAVYHDLGTLSFARVGLSPSWLCVLLLAYTTLVPARGRHHSAVVSLSVLALPAGAVVAAQLGLFPEVTLDRLLSAAAGAALPALVCGVEGLGVVARGRQATAERETMEAKLTQLGSYKLERKLGEGGMGEVWRATHAFLAKPAAVKLIRAEMLTGKNDAESTRLAQVAIARFEREARATASLTSTNTIQIFDFGRATPTSFFYAMELLDGIDLHTLVYRYGPQPEGRVISVLRQACDSLAEAHDHGFIHRDIKPANIFVCRLGHRYDHVKVLDFGLVLTDADVLAHNPDAPRLTRTGHITGTPNSIAPEQASGQVLDGRADLYALGCVAYFALTGTDVFTADTTVQYLAKHMRDVPDPPSTRMRPGTLHPELERIVLRLLAKARDDRPASAQDLARELEVLAAERPWTQADARAWADAHGITGPELERAVRVEPDALKTDAVRLFPQREA